MEKSVSDILQLRTPLELVQRMDAVLGYARKGTKIIHQAHADYLKAKHDYNLAYMKAKLAADGTVGDREAKAQLENWELFTAMEIAEMAMKHAQDKRKELLDELSKLQSEAALLRADMSLGR